MVVVKIIDLYIFQVISAITFDKRKHIEDPIACITSMADPTACFDSWMSACTIEHIYMT